MRTLPNRRGAGFRGAIARAVVLVTGSTVFIGPTALAQPIAVATRTARPPVIDGRGNEAAWGRAVPFDSFTQQMPDDGRPASERTEVRILFDDRALYFLFRCFDSTPSEIVAILTRRDRETLSDLVAVDLDTRGDHHGSFHFQINAAGVQRDALRTGDDSYNDAWDAVWAGRSRLESWGWTAELEIPWTALRFGVADLGRFRMQVRRLIARRFELDQWAYLPRTEQGELLRYGPLSGIERVAVPRGVELVPFVLAQSRYRSALSDRGVPYGAQPAADVGLDARWGLGAGLTLDAALLPDFGQVEADQVVLNLSTFELSFPERRPFFLQGADQFSVPDVYGEPQPAQPFYSRRIGLAPPAPYLPAGARLVDAPERVGIWAALKLTGRIGDRLSIALLDALTAAEEAIVVRGGDVIHVHQPLAPLGNYLVARLRLDAGRGLRVGATATSVTRIETPGTLGLDGVCPEELARGPDGRCTHDALTGEMDLLWHSRGGGWLASATLLASRIDGGPARTLRDGTVIGSGDADLGWRLQLGKASGRIALRAIWEAYGPRLDLNDAGFLRQQNLHRWFGRLAWREFGRGPTRDTNTGVELSVNRSWDDVPLSFGVEANNFTNWRNLWGTWIRFGGFAGAWDNRETRDGAVAERPGWGNVEAAFSTNPARWLYADLGVYAKNTWRGVLVEAGGTILARPLPFFELSLAPSLQRVTGDPRWVDRLDGPGTSRTYLFGLQDALAFGATLRTTVSFTPSVTLTAYAQLFLASVEYGEMFESVQGGARPWIGLGALGPSAADPQDYASRDAVLNVNLVLRWEYRPGSVLYFGYTRGQGGDVPTLYDRDGRALLRPRLDLAGIGRAQREEVLFVKLSYHFSS